jgi:nucleoside-diphosphate-sugar epimerase
MKTILITGSTGFVGTVLCRRMLREGLQVTAAVRNLSSRSLLPEEANIVNVGPISPMTTWTSALNGANTVVHLAARTHAMRELSKDPLQAYRSINVEGTERLARSAAVSGVKRFIYISSVKVNGEGKDEPYTELATPAPEDAYGISKWEAEQTLRRIEAETGMEVVIIRPTLIYGPGVKANILALLKIVKRGFPLPLGNIHNRRSLIYVGNIVDAIAVCAAHPEAAGQTYMVSDNEDVSTPELIKCVAQAQGRKPRIFPFPESLLRLAGSVIGRESTIDRLFRSLTVDTSKIRRELGWKPPFTMQEGMTETAKWFLNRA